MTKSTRVAEDILTVIGKENIVSFTNCMTRLRVKAKPNFDAEKLKSIDGVLGLVMGGADEFQIVLGPGFVNKVAADFAKLVEIKSEPMIEERLDGDFQSAAELAKLEKQKLRAGGKVKNFLTKISKVFTPLIPAFIGAGLLSGIAGIVVATSGNTDTIKSWNNVLSISLTILTNVFIIAVGWRMGEEFGGNPGLSALMAAMFCGFAGVSVSAIFIPTADGEAYNFLGMIINKADISKNWFTTGFVNYNTSIIDGVAVKTEVLGAPHAGLIGAMIAAAVTIAVEKRFRKFMPGAIDTILTPIIVIAIMLVLNFVLIIPLAGYLFTGITWLFNHLYTNAFGAALLAGIFLFALAFGVHQGFLPIYFALMAETGVNGLFPIMCMGGVAQVGVAIAMWFMAGKGSTLRKQISGAIIPGFLGIGEPLIYGISLPRVKPFFLSCITAAIGGFIMGALNTWAGLGIGMNAATGPGGLTAAIMMTTIDGNVVVGILVYLAVVFTVYGIGAGICFFGYSKIARNGSEKTNQIFKGTFSSLKDPNVKFSEKILGILTCLGLSLAYLTGVGLVAIWSTWYWQLNQEQKTELKAFQLV